MHYVPFGKTGLKVSGLCLGTMTFGLQCDEAASQRIMDEAATGGIDFFDVADIYPLGGDMSAKGRTEEIVGRWMKGKRHDFILATKCVGQMGPKPWQSGMSRTNVMRAIDASLARLGTDYVDLYQLHHDDPATPLDEALSALDAIVRAGKARYVGVSNWMAHRVARAIGRSEARNFVRIDSVQPRYNLLFRTFERDLLPLAEAEGVAVIPYNPLAAGMLTGKHTLDRPPQEGRFSLGAAAPMYRERYWKSQEFDTVEALRKIAGEAGLSMTEMSLRWVMSNPAITAPIIGASKPEQLAESIAAANKGPLPSDLKTALDQMTMQWRAVDAVR